MPEAAAGLGGATVRDELARAAARLGAAGCESPRLDAELLLAEALGADRARLVVDAREVLDARTVARFGALLSRRLAREPVAYILGRREFRRLTLMVDRRVLIPRPETELLVEVALALPSGARVIDVGTGSGAVALALASERPDLAVWGSDVSPGALGVARANGARLGLAVEFVRSDLLEEVPGPFEAVLANLPYVRDGESLPADVGRFEPPGALFGGSDGLALIGRLCGQLGDIGFAALEVGLGQAGAVAQLLGGAGYGSVEVLSDLAGIERVVVGRRR